MTPAEIRKNYRFPERIEGKLEWRFYPKRETRPSHYLYVRFHVALRIFVVGSIDCDGVTVPTDPLATLIHSFGSVFEADDKASLRSLLPAVAVAQCTAASLQLETPQS